MNLTYAKFDATHGNQLGLGLPGMFDDGGSSSGGGGKFNTIFNGVLGIGSQIISAFGKQPSQQVTSGGVVPIGGGYSYGQYQQPQYQPQYQQQPTIQPGTVQPGGVGAGAVQVGAGFLDSVAQSFGVSTGTFTALGIVATALYFMKPKR